jgi:thiamine pyrophosphate-dependent acetolactate synthase large subunit-like protein
MAKTVADQFAEILATAGVKRIYGIVGDSLNGLTDALRRQDKIEWVHVRHEEVAAFAAGAEAHLTGELAVCAGSCGPGNLHLINGLFDCHRSRVAVLAIAAAQTIGAQSAFPGRQVISLSGDGGFAMLMGDFLSLVQLRLPVKVVVFNYGALGFIEIEQKSTGFLETGTELQNPNFAAMAEAVGVRGIRLEDPDDVEAGIAAALAHDGPVLVAAVVNRTELAMPPAVTTEMAKGFTLYMVKAVMSGRGDELIDLARTNLWR